jgi:hypothetical protein
MGADQPLYADGADRFAASEDRLLDPAGNRYNARFVYRRQIPCLEKAIFREGLLVVFR